MSMTRAFQRLCADPLLSCSTGTLPTFLTSLPCLVQHYIDPNVGYNNAYLAYNFARHQRSCNLGAQSRNAEGQISGESTAMQR